MNWRVNGEERNGHRRSIAAVQKWHMLAVAQNKIIASSSLSAEKQIDMRATVNSIVIGR